MQISDSPDPTKQASELNQATSVTPTANKAFLDPRSHPAIWAAINSGRRIDGREIDKLFRQTMKEPVKTRTPPTPNLNLKRTRSSDRHDFDANSSDEWRTPSKVVKNAHANKSHAPPRLSNGNKFSLLNDIPQSTTFKQHQAILLKESPHKPQ